VDLIQALGGGYENDAVAARPRPAPEQDSLTPIVERLNRSEGIGLFEKRAKNAS